MLCFFFNFFFFEFFSIGDTHRGHPEPRGDTHRGHPEPRLFRGHTSGTPRLYWGPVVYNALFFSGQPEFCFFG